MNGQPMKTIVCGLIKKGQNLLIAKRPDHVHLGGFWEFPGGKVEAGESLEEALVRECLEELGVLVEVMDHFRSFVFEYTEVKLTFHFFLCQIIQGKPEVEPEKLRWVPLSELQNISFPAANRELIASLQESPNAFFKGE